MSDSPKTYVNPNPVSICTTDMCCQAGFASLLTGNQAGVATWAIANTAIYVPIQIEVPFKVITIGIKVSVQSGNLDVGLYDEKGNALVTKGSTAVGVAGMQFIDMSASISHGAASPVLMPGTYYAAMNVDNTTASLGRVAVAQARLYGVQTQAVGAVALPTTATMATTAGASNVPTLILSGHSVI